VKLGIDIQNDKPTPPPASFTTELPAVALEIVDSAMRFDHPTPG
jgi:hypothetical protein